MIEQILPPAVAVAESFTDPAGLTPHPQEEPLVAAAVEKRRREFTTVRHCARRALSELGVAPVPILTGTRGAPVWPAGIVGSMTHCDGYRGAVLGRVSAFATLGVDAEPHAPLPEGVLEAIALPSEQARGAALASTHPGVCWDRLLFSAKESVYKAWFPLTRRWLDFSEADITVDPAGTFVARLLVPGPVLGGVPVAAFTGRFLVDGGLVLTAIAVPAVAG
ncbi:4'-phosphopantetheinyl transferase [Micromonospora sp. NPDC048830]|uniref:4'-phosphopantetheinyl transferase family protein n=1 Tax=Micromonospora sp. NPDC048830 TaxID=3364257 RepID=UPI00371427F7